MMNIVSGLVISHQNQRGEKEMYKQDIKPLRKAFKINGWKGWEENDRLYANLTHKEKNGMHLYNYNNTVLVDRNHPVLMKCRGIVVDDNGKVLNYPFDRFFNDFEKEKAVINWDMAKVQEKIDGSLICVFWANDEWQTTTRGSFYPNKEAKFDEWFKKLFGDLNKLYKGYCYMFELVSRNNRIVTWYDREFIVLLGMRETNVPFKEETATSLDDVALGLKVVRPQLYGANDIADCKKLFARLKEDDEGLVIVDDEFNRVKLKQESYIKLSKIKMLKPANLFEHIIGKVAVDEEYLAKCPEVIVEMNKMKETWENYKNIIWTTFEDIKPLATKSRKDFAMEAVQHKYKALLFALLDGHTINEAVTWQQVEYLFKKEG